MEKSKKTYTAPQVTEHGNAVKETKGFGGQYFEMICPKPDPVIIED